MPDTKIRPLSLSELHSRCVRDVLNSVLICIAVAALFWAINFGTSSSPSVSRLLVTATMPAMIFGDLIRYFRAKRHLDFAQPLPAGALPA